MQEALAAATMAEMNEARRWTRMRLRRALQQCAAAAAGTHTRLTPATTLHQTAGTAVLPHPVGAPLLLGVALQGFMALVLRGLR
jgi:hypothetical protein